jgi:hypothetical protein
MDAELMKVGELLLPERLVALIDAGLWPHTAKQARNLMDNCNVPQERIHLFAPEEDHLYLAVPPFHTIAERVTNQGKGLFWSRFGALEQIAPELSVDIGFFGLGSDSAIVLDYRQGGSNPPVLRLRWRKPEPNMWVRCADNFDEFADMLGLDKP